MNTRFKLMSIMGAESLFDGNPTQAEVTQSLQTHIIDNVFGGTQEKVIDNEPNIEANPEAVELQTHIELAGATTDLEESDKLVREFIKQEEDQQAALEDLEVAVSGIESLFKGEFDPNAYRAMMKHATRCANRAGVELPINVDGMESMSSANLYLNIRQGMEGFLDSVKQGAKDAKAFFIKLYNLLIDMVRDKLNEVRSATKAYQTMVDKVKDYDGDIAKEFTVAKWYESTQHRNQNTHHSQSPTGVTSAMLSAADDLDIKKFAQGELRDAEFAIRGPFQYSFKTSAIEVKKKDDITTGNFTLGKYFFNFGFKDFQPSTEEELKEFVSKTFFKVSGYSSNEFKVGSTLPAAFHSKQDIMNVLEGNLTWCKFIDRFTKKHQDDLKRERDFVIAGLASKDGLTRDPRPLVRMKQQILSSMFKAHTDVMRADLLLVKAHLS